MAAGSTASCAISGRGNCLTRWCSRCAIESAVQGDLEGVGRWHFSNEGAVSVVRYEWHLHSTTVVDEPAHLICPLDVYP